jgi:hypothetical protein
MIPLHHLREANMKQKYSYITALTSSVILGSCALSQAATVVWNFDTPSLDGWTSVTTPTATGTQYGVGTVDGGQSGSHFLAVINGDTDTATEVNVMKSEAFTFDLTSGLSAYLRKGAQGSALVYTPVGVYGATTGGGFRGIGLYDVASDSYLLTAGRSTNDSDWQQVTWSVGDLTGAGVTSSAQYELHLIDQATGGWGHVQLDSVSFNGAIVPEPSAALLGGMGVLALLRRRRA